MDVGLRIDITPTQAPPTTPVNANSNTITADVDATRPQGDLVGDLAEDGTDDGAPERYPPLGRIVLTRGAAEDGARDRPLGWDWDKRWGRLVIGRDSKRWGP